MLIALYIILATSSIAITVTKSILFEPVRKFVKNLNPKLGELISCYFCLSHWIICTLSIIYLYDELVDNLPLFILKVFAMLMVSLLISITFIRISSK